MLRSLGWRPGILPRVATRAHRFRAGERGISRCARLFEQHAATRDDKMGRSTSTVRPYMVGPTVFWRVDEEGMARMRGADARGNGSASRTSFARCVRPHEGGHAEGHGQGIPV